MTSVMLDTVKEFTDSFFEKHWSSHLPTRPEWNDVWAFIGGLPGGDTQGVYLLMSENEEVLYIGVGASKVGGRYSGHGIGSRVSEYHRMAEGQRSVSLEQRKYIPKGDWAERGLAKIVTIGFTSEYAYMAYALEAFLIRETETPHNKVRSARLS
ncbi:hypothetical protein [Oceanisphaera sp. W20_SRM_FM3]|uniref:hypothetical protein n=1 Tax=Oceanisphaera sp. W20_SRM_FM3 TaxID=3240267 RepID=UPI003F9C96C1